MCVCVCVCACVCERVVCVCERVVCVCVYLHKSDMCDCISEYEHEFLCEFKCTDTYVYICVHVFVFVHKYALVYL